MSQPLEGVRVLDLSRILAGPSCTQLLGDLGADVIKIERPGTGDDVRGWGPPFLRDKDGEETAESAYFIAANRNKRSVTLNIEAPEGRALLQKLIAGADVLVENFKVGDLERRGFGYDALKRLAPSLIYCSITGFGQTGPYATRPGYDFIIQGMGGLMAITGESDGEPMKVGVPISDIMAGMYASVSILAALHKRTSTGRGQRIDVSLLDCQLGWLYNQASNYLIGRREPARHGNAHPNIVPYQTFDTVDGRINVAVGNDGQFARLCEVVGRPALAEEPRFATNTARLANRDLLIAQLGEAFARGSSTQWLEALERAAVPCGPIYGFGELFDDPHVKARGMVTELVHSAAPDAPFQMVSSPVRMSEGRPETRYPPPVLGEHTFEVLAAECGIDHDRFAILKEKGVI